MAGSYPRATADEATEVGGLGQRTLAARRGDLERIALPLLAKQRCDPLAQRKRHTIGMVDEHAQHRVGGGRYDLGEQHLDFGLALGETPLDICL
jgi:hypothetical protein